MAYTDPAVVRVSRRGQYTTTETFYTCDECGALVMAFHSATHDEWHEKFADPEETDCTCGWGGTHDPDNPKCAKNKKPVPCYDCGMFHPYGEHPAPPRGKP